MIDFKTGAMFAGVTAMWSQLKGIFDRIRGLLFINIQIEAGNGSVIMDYLWENYKVTGGNKRYFIAQSRIKATGNWGKVPYEQPSSAMTFWNGCWPVYVSYEESKESGPSPGKINISYFRGTFNFQDTIFTACKVHKPSKQSKRFYYQQRFGNYSSGPSHENGQRVHGSHHNAGMGSRPIGYKPEELGEDQPLSPFSRLYLGYDALKFVEQVKHWHKSKDWFISRGVPWKLSAMFKGKPGTGKSSLVKAIAQELDMPIHSYDLSSMSNQELSNYWKDSLSEAPIVILLEDIDRVFHDQKTVIEHEHKGNLTLDCLLNLTSGVTASDGVLLIVTANFPDRLDPALTRAGRIEKHIEIAELSEDHRYDMASRILYNKDRYRDGLEDSELNEVEEIVKAHNQITGAEFQKICTERANELFWQSKEN